MQKTSYLIQSKLTQTDWGDSTLSYVVSLCHKYHQQHHCFASLLFCHFDSEKRGLPYRLSVVLMITSHYWFKCSCRSTWWAKLTYLIPPFTAFISEKSFYAVLVSTYKNQVQFRPYLRQTVLNFSGPWAKFNHLSLALGPGLIKNALVNLSCHQNQVVSQLPVYASSVLDWSQKGPVSTVSC